MCSRSAADVEVTQLGASAEGGEGMVLYQGVNFTPFFVIGFEVFFFLCFWLFGWLVFTYFCFVCVLGVVYLLEFASYV